MNSKAFCKSYSCKHQCLKYNLIVIRAISATTLQACLKVFQAEGCQLRCVRSRQSCVWTQLHLSGNHIWFQIKERKKVCANSQFINLSASLYYIPVVVRSGNKQWKLLHEGSDLGRAQKTIVYSNNKKRSNNLSSGTWAIRKNPEKHALWFPQKY